MASVEKIILLNAALTADRTTDAVSMDMFTKDFMTVIVATSVHADTTIAAKLQHSADGSTWFDLVSFASIAGAAGSEAKAISGPVLPQVRAVVDLSGSTLAATIKIELCCDRMR